MIASIIAPRVGAHATEAAAEAITHAGIFPVEQANVAAAVLIAQSIHPDGNTPAELL